MVIGKDKGNLIDDLVQRIDPLIVDAGDKRVIIQMHSDADLLDEFAKAAMQGILANPSTSVRVTMAEVAKESFDYADAMMKERARRREAGK